MTVERADASTPTFFGPSAQPGEILAGRYRVMREIGAGGMGQVLEVEHTELEKRFALKLIRPDRWDEKLEARFRREARSLARVVTPRVAQVTDFGVDPTRGPFYVMELVDGEPLDALIRREGPLPRARALELAIGLAEALVDVHEAGIVHRDVKPANVGVCARGPVRVRLFDFGLAASVDDRFGSRMTESRRVIGSMPYMAPEQFHGEEPSPSMDVWALGVVLYEMLTGHLPFDAPSTAALINMILNETLPLDDPRPRECADVLERLLMKERVLRAESASEALALLRRAARRDPSEPIAIGAVADTAEATKVDTNPPPPMSGPSTLRSLGAPRLPEHTSTPTEEGRPAGPAAARATRVGAALAIAGALALVGALAWIGGATSERRSDAAPHGEPPRPPSVAVAPGPPPAVLGASTPAHEIATPPEIAPAPPAAVDPDEPGEPPASPTRVRPTRAAGSRAAARATEAPRRAREERERAAEPAASPPPAEPPDVAPPADVEPPAAAPWAGGIIETPEP